MNLFNLKETGMLATWFLIFVVAESRLQTYAGTSANQQTLEETPRQTIMTLLNLPHGLHKLSPEHKIRLDRITQNPKPYVEVLNSLYSNIDIVRIKDSTNILRFERAIALLTRIGVSDALSQLESWYVVLDSAKLDSANILNRPNLLRFQRIILVELGGTKRDEILSRTLTTLEAMDHATRNAAITYITLCSIGDNKVVSQLRRYFNNESSNLYRDKAIEKAIKMITKDK